MKKLLCLMLFCLLLNSTIYAGNRPGFMTTDQKAALDGANAPSASNVLATEADVAAADTGVQTAGAGVNLSNSGDTDNPIFDLDISENVDMDTNQLTNLKLPAGLGQAVRTTAKISEVILEAMKDKVDGIEDNATRDQSDTEIEALLAGLTGDDRLSSDSLREGVANLFITPTQETDWQRAYDKVNDDSAVWSDKYTQAQITDYLALKLDIADSPVIDDTAYNPTSWDGNNDAATKNAIRDKIVDIDTAVGLNTAKDTNVPTALSEGTRDDTTYGINSDGGNDDIILPQANTNQAGLLSGTKWNEIVANTAKDTNVSTDLSEGTSTDTTVDVNSSDGNNMTLQPASTSRAGVMSKAKFDEVVANTAKANSLTRYLHWSPAYNGYTLSADGSNNDAGDSGIIVAFAGTLGDSAVEDTPYIEWASTTAGVNDYDVIVRIPIPADYSSMGTFRVEYDSDTVLEDTATVYIYDSNDASDSSVVLSSSTWAVDETMTPSGTYTAGAHMTLKLHLECAQNQKMRVGEIRCSYEATR